MSDGGYGSFAAFVAARQTALLRSATLMTGDVHLAQDLLQEAFLKLAVRWPRVRAGNPEAYVRRILYRDLLSWRWRLRHENLGQHVEVTGRDATQAADEHVVVMEALRLLTPKQRAVMVLRYFEDLPEAQVAELLGVSVGTVKSQCHAALARLRSVAPELGSVASGERRDD